MRDGTVEALTVTPAFFQSGAQGGARTHDQFKRFIHCEFDAELNGLIQDKQNVKRRISWGAGWLGTGAVPQQRGATLVAEMQVRFLHHWKHAHQTFQSETKYRTHAVVQLFELSSSC